MSERFSLDNIVRVINSCSDEMVRKRIRSIRISESFASKVSESCYNQFYCRALKLDYSSLDLIAIHRLMLLTYYKSLEV